MLNLNKNTKKTVIRQVCTLFGFAILAVDANALVILQNASVSNSIDYDNNVSMSKNAQSVWRYNLVPNYSISAVSDLNRWYSNASVNVQRSTDKNLSIDRQDPTVTIGWDRELVRGKFSLSADYSRASTRITEFQNSGLVSNDGSSINKAININWSRALSERLVWSLGGSAVQSTFSGGGSLSSYKSKSLTSNLSYELNDRLKPFINLAYTTYDSQDSQQGLEQGTQNSRAYTGGFSYQINPILSTSFSAGITRLSSGVGKVGEMSFSYVGEQTRLSGAYSRNVTPSGIGGFQNADNISLDYAYSMSEKSDVGTSFNWRKNNSLNDVESKQLSVFYSLSLTEYWLMRFSIQTREIKSTNQSVNGEILGISLIYNTPEF